MSLSEAWAERNIFARTIREHAKTSAGGCNASMHSLQGGVSASRELLEKADGAV